MAPVVVALICLLAALPAAADVVLDGSFGTEGPVLPGQDPDGNFTDHLIEQDFGKLEQRNLFHSFRNFSIAVGQSATFTAQSPVDNVIARVTGMSASQIDGALRSTIDGADVFLLNPYGVFFGSESSLDVRGSFHVSTADVLVFPDLDWPTGVAGAGLLSSAPPSAFGFLDAAPAPIRFEGARLTLPEGSTLTAVGGPIEVAGRASATVPALQAPGGRIQLASVASPMQVPIDVASLDPSSLEAGALAGVSFTQRTVVDVSAGAASGSGTVVIRGGRFCMGAGPACDGIDSARAGEIRALTAATEGAPTAIDIQVAGDLVLDSRALVQSGSGGAARSGDILLAGETVHLKGRATVGTSTDGSGAGGDVRIEGGALEMSGSAQIVTLASASGGAGSVEVTMASVDVSDRAQIATLSFGSGGAGSVGVEAERVELSDRGQLASESSGSGAGGLIDVKAQTLTLTSEAKLSSLSQADGGGSAIHVEAASVSVTDSAQIASEARGTQAGGNIELSSDELSVSGGGQITTQVAVGASGRGGDLVVDADTVRVSTGDLAPVVSQIGALTDSQKGGAGGNLTLDVGSLELSDGGQIRTTTTGTGRSGELVIRATDVVRALGIANVMDEDGEGSAPSGIFARSAPDATGDGGRLFIEARAVEVENGAEISARTFGAGNAGALEIQARDGIKVAGGENGASVISARGFEGEGGALQLTTGQLELTSGGQVTASTAGSGDSGDLTIDAERVFIAGADPSFNNPSGIFAQSNAFIIDVPDGGNAGDITLTASESLEITNEGRISVASRGAGNSGSITIKGGDLIELSSGGEITARAESSGSAGSITILDAKETRLSDGAAVTAQTTGYPIFNIAT